MKQIVKNKIDDLVPGLSMPEIDELTQKAWDIRVSDLRASWQLANDTERFSIITSYQKVIAESSRNL